MAERTLYVAQKGKLVPWTIPKRELKEGQVRVEVHSASINPIDWMTIDNQLADGCGQGNDFAGVVVETGPGVTGIEVGSTVAGGVGGGDVDNKENGAFTDLLTVDEHLLFKFPHPLKDAGSTDLSKCGIPTTYEQAASLGLVLDTVALAFEHHFPKKGDWCLIYGVTGAVGYTAAQYARNIGYEVIGVSSDLPEVTSTLEGVHWLDRKDSKWPQKAKELANNHIVYTLDAITKPDEVAAIFEAIGENSVVQFLQPGFEVPPHISENKPKVSVEHPLYFFLMQESKKLGTARFPDPDQTTKRAPQIVAGINEQLAHNKIKTLPITLVSGFDKIPDGLEKSRNGVRGTKVVVKRIAQ